MDEMVLKAMLKWPNVPSCKGWLGLDGRGDWYVRDDQAQMLGPFSGGDNEQLANVGSKGSRLQHEGLVAFIGRNYASDAVGRWYFQNGPQRVYVELSHAPWIWRIAQGATGQISSHTGLPATAHKVFMDEEGLVYVATDLGLGLVHSQDMALCADLIEAGIWQLSESMASDTLPSHFKFMRSPAASTM